MSKTCARCKKTVYPLEELKCFDKIWHKSCFRCTVCGMALTLKNYRGFERMPYCSAHMPKVQATQIASTPEMKRLTNNTRIQSNIKYHEEYERAKRKNQQTDQVSETVRNKQGSKMSANVAYRVCKFENKNIVQQRKRELDEGLRKNSSNRSNLNEASTSATKRPSLINLYQAKTRTGKPLPTSDSSHSSYSHSTDSSISSPKLISSSGKTSFNTSISTMSSSTRSVPKENVKRQRLDAGNAPENVQEIYLRSNSGKLNPLTTSEDSMFSKMDRKTSTPFVRDQSRTDNFTADSNITLTDNIPRIIPMTASKWEQEDSTVTIGGIFDIELAQRMENLLGTEPDKPSTSPQNSRDVEYKASQLNFNVYRAIKRFEAHESDEVGFEQNDVIYEVLGEDSGWITGRVERTSKIGLFPANHVEKIERQSQLELAKKAQPSKIEGRFGEPLNTAEQKLFN